MVGTMGCVCVAVHDTNLHSSCAEQPQRAGNSYNVAVIQLQHLGEKRLGGLWWWWGGGTEETEEQGEEKTEEG